MLSDKPTVMGYYSSERCTYRGIKKCNLIDNEYFTKIKSSDRGTSFTGFMIKDPPSILGNCPAYKKLEILFSNVENLIPLLKGAKLNVKMGSLFFDSDRLQVIYEKVSDIDSLQITIEGPYIHKIPLCYITTEFTGGKDLKDKIIKCYEDLKIPIKAEKAKDQKAKSSKILGSGISHIQVQELDYSR